MTSQIWSPPWYVSQSLRFTEKKSAIVARTWKATIATTATTTCRATASAARPSQVNTGFGRASAAVALTSRGSPGTRPTVRARPSSSGTAAVNPNSSSARVVSSLRRGCPFGFEVSQRIVPSNPVASRTSRARSPIAISSPVPRLTGSAPS